jgi:predicted nuclease of predicted toxin-antitoxin system
VIEPIVVRLILDQGVPRDAAGQLRDLGYECIHVEDIGMWNATDHEILATAAEEGATIVTLDADFHAILAVSGYSKPSVIRLRLEGLRAGAVVEIVKRVLGTFASDLAAGSLITVKGKKTTCRKLPIGLSK